MPRGEAEMGAWEKQHSIALWRNGRGLSGQKHLTAVRMILSKEMYTWPTYKPTLLFEADEET